MLKIYEDCSRLNNSNLKMNCWHCRQMDLCASCKVMGCTNEEKDFMIDSMVKKGYDKG